MIFGSYSFLAVTASNRQPTDVTMYVTMSYHFKYIHGYIHTCIHVQFVPDCMMYSEATSHLTLPAHRGHIIKDKKNLFCNLALWHPHIMLVSICLVWFEGDSILVASCMWKWMLIFKKNAIQPHAILGPIICVCQVLRAFGNAKIKKMTRVQREKDNEIIFLYLVGFT